MKKIFYYILLIFTSIKLVSCGTKVEYKEIFYKDLPFEVRDKFIERYNYKEDPKTDKNGQIDYYSPPFAECYDLNLNCNCKLETVSNPLGTPKFIIESCNKNIEIPWSVFQRVFIIKGDSIFYPWATEGTTSTGEARSYNIKIDTLKFRLEKMKIE